MYEYNPKDCVTTIDGTYLSGYSQSMITANKDNPLVQIAEGCQGDAIANVSCSQLGTMTITLQATSPSNKLLTKLANNRTFFSIWCNNKTLGERVGGTRACVETFATIEQGATAGDRVYTVKILDFYVDRYK